MQWPMIERVAGRYALPIVLFALASFLAFKVTVSLRTSAFVSGGAANPTSVDIGKVLDAMTSQGRLRQGAIAELAELRRNDGLSLSLIVAEGKFGPSSIEPEPVWIDLLKRPTLLVSSGDELLRNNGGISKSIGIGCDIKQVKIPLATGELFPSDCNGPYKRMYPNVQGVRSAIIKAWSSVDERADCEPKSISEIEGPQSEYTKCVSDAIKISLTSLFRKGN